MTQIIIEKLLSIDTPGVFSNFRSAADLPPFQTKNLIYGFNGSGKTTISRLFAGIAAGAIDPELPAGTKFAFQLSNNSTVTETAIAALKGRLLVYNGDFVSRSFRWGEGEAEPIFYLGKQADLSKELEAAKAAVLKGRSALAQAAETRQSRKRNFDDFKTTTASAINAAIRPRTQYRANNLEADYSTKHDEAALLAVERLEQLAALLGQTQARSKLPATKPATGFSLQELLVAASRLLEQTPGALVLEDIAAHDSKLGWIKEGYEYHTAHKIEHCLFCGHSLTQERLATLKQIIDDKLSQLLADVDAAIRDINKKVSSVRELKAGLPIKDQLDPTVQAEFETMRSRLAGLADDALKVLGQLQNELDAKKGAPNRAIVLDASFLDGAAVWDESWSDIASDFVGSVQRHNELQDSFDKQKDEARELLKEHYLAQSQARYLELASASAEAAQLAKKAEDDLKVQEDLVKGLEQKLRNHGPAAELINGMIASFLGHSEIAIEAADSGYRLARATQGQLGHLSEGEKTAITVCYFLTLLEAEGRKPGDLIVVVDDPISSLDTRSLNYAFNLLKSRLDKVAQLFILTHNLHFMNEAKKWIKPSRKQQEQGVEPSLFFLESKQAGDPARRSSSIVKMPKLLREYESEYQYMFSLVRRAVYGDSFSDLLFLLPNAMRKILEVFIAFKVPGSSGLSSSLDSEPFKSCGIDAARLRSLERLSHVESHGDSLDDLVAVSPMTVEEAKQAAVTLLEVIEKIDAHHYGRMCGLCR